MEKQRVISTKVRFVGYDVTSSKLEVEFNDDDVYQYYDVPEMVYTAFV